jgi:hypothetical protein
MMRKEREIEDKHKEIMRENKRRRELMEKQAKEKAEQEKIAQEKALQERKKEIKENYDKFFKPNNNNLEKIERSMSRGAQRSGSKDRDGSRDRKTQTEAGRRTEAGRPPAYVRPPAATSSQQNIGNYYPNSQGGVSIDHRAFEKKNEWLERQAGDVKDILGLDMTGSFVQMEQMIKEQMEGKVLPEPQVPAKQIQPRLTQPSIGQGIFDCDVSVIPNK